MEPELEVYKWCRENKDRIVKAADQGDADARNIITAHQMLVRFPEQIALGLLESAVSKFKKQRGEI